MQDLLTAHVLRQGAASISRQLSTKVLFLNVKRKELKNLEKFNLTSGDIKSIDEVEPLVFTQTVMCLAAVKGQSVNAPPSAALLFFCIQTLKYSHGTFKTKQFKMKLFICS